MKEIIKNTQEIIRIQNKEYKGSDLIDIRVFYEKDGEYLPTKKGITFNPKIAKDVIEGIMDAIE